MEKDPEIVVEEIVLTTMNTVADHVILVIIKTDEDEMMVTGTERKMASNPC